MINFNALQTDFHIDRLESKKKWLMSAISTEAKTIGDIQYVFCSEEYLAEINWKFLKHDTFTDIITFSNSNSNLIVSGDIFISLDRVKANAKDLNILFESELDRVLIHGILHLIGYNDTTPDERLQMRAKEDYYLHLQP